MTLPSYPGPIKLSQLQTEFGGSNPIRLGGEYHAGQGYVPSGSHGYPIVNDVSTYTLIPSGTTSRISLGNFFGGDVTEFYFLADYIVLTYYFATGRDLDTRTRITSPAVNGTYVGWGFDGNNVLRFEGTGNPYNNGDSYIEASQDLPNGNIALLWAGDNIGTGLESVMVNVANIRGYYGNTTITVDLRAQWYTTVGTTPVKVQADLYKGGTMRYLSGQYTWDNPTATSSSLDISSGQINATDIRGPTNGINGYPIDGIDADQGISEIGTSVATLTYNSLTGQGTINMTGTGF